MVSKKKVTKKRVSKKKVGKKVVLTVRSRSASVVPEIEVGGCDGAGAEVCTTGGPETAIKPEDGIEDGDEPLIQPGIVAEDGGPQLVPTLPSGLEMIPPKTRDKNVTMGLDNTDEGDWPAPGGKSCYGFDDPIKLKLSDPVPAEPEPEVVKAIHPSKQYRSIAHIARTGEAAKPNWAPPQFPVTTPEENLSEEPAESKTGAGPEEKVSERVVSGSPFEAPMKLGDVGK